MEELWCCYCLEHVYHAECCECLATERTEVYSAKINGKEKENG